MAATNKRVLFTVPPDVKDWLEESARYHGATKSAEVVRSVRERMERERAAGRETKKFHKATEAAE